MASSLQPLMREQGINEALLFCIPEPIDCFSSSNQVRTLQKLDVRSGIIASQYLLSCLYFPISGCFQFPLYILPFLFLSKTQLLFRMRWNLATISVFCLLLQILNASNRFVCSGLETNSSAKWSPGPDSFFLTSSF